MARSRGGRRMAPPDLLTALTADPPEAAARGNAGVLPMVERIEGAVAVLRRYAFAWSLFIVTAVIGCIVLDAAARFGLLQPLAALP